MPIYEYLCEACKNQIEVMQKFTDPAPETCASCGNGPMVKQMSLSSFALKGTGWYETDFKGKPKVPSPPKDGENSETTAPSQAESKAANAGATADKVDAARTSSDKPTSANKASPESAPSPSKSESSKSEGSKT